MGTKLQQSNANVWDVIVVGGGPAGMMAAATAAARGKRVVLLEKNQAVGKKLLITGGGRCNITNNKPVVRTMVAAYKEAGKYLFSAFSQHAVAESIVWFATRGVPLVEENEGRLFPEAQTAKVVWDALVQELRTSGVTVQSRSDVVSITKPTATSFAVTLKSGVRLHAPACVIATGGTSRPETGSTGDGFLFATAFGHHVIQNNYALVPITIQDTWLKKLAGVTITNVKVSVYSDSKKISATEGKVLCTHVGLSGPLILNQSKMIGELLTHSVVTLKIDILPGFDAGTLKQHFQRLCSEASNKKIKNVLSSLIPTALVGPLLTLALIDGEMPCHSVRTADRARLMQLVKAVPLTVSGLLGSDKAVIAAGGVVPTEIDFKTMQSRLVPGLFLVGDVLHIDRPSGGYSLQLCWTTGYVAGTHL